MNAHFYPVREASGEVWRFVSGFVREKRGARDFMILHPQAIIDDSGSEPQSPFFVFGGFVASATEWAAFADEWRAVLDKPPRLDYFKMTEASRLRDQFDEKKGWTEAKRDDRVSSLIRVIKKHVAARIHASISNQDFADLISSLPTPERNLGVDSPYIIMFMQVVLAYATYAEHTDVKEPCDFIFDQQGEFSVTALAWWPTLKSLMDGSKYKLGRHVGSPPIFRDDKTFLPLQAADLYAGQIRLNQVQNRVLVVPASRVLRQCADIPVIGRHYGRVELERLRDSLIEAGKSFAAQNPSVPLVHAGRTRAERKRIRKQTKGVLASISKKGQPS